MLNDNILMWFVIYWLVSALLMYIKITNFFVLLKEGNDKVKETYNHVKDEDFSDTEYSNQDDYLNHVRSVFQQLPESTVSTVVLFASLLFGGIFVPKVLFGAFMRCFK